MAEFEDKELECKKCGREFTWTAGEQKFYQEKGLKHQPKTCPLCRKKRKKNEPLDVQCSLCHSKGHIKLEELSEKDLKNRSVVCKKCMEKEKSKIE